MNNIDLIKERLETKGFTYTLSQSGSQQLKTNIYQQQKTNIYQQQKTNIYRILI